MSTAVFLCVGLWVGQVDGPDPTTQQQLPQLLRQLDDDRLAVREAAEATLIEMGPAIMDQLPTLAVVTSPEVKERLGRIRAALEVQLARERIQPSRVSLSGEMSCVAAFRSIQQQTGNQLAGYEQADVPVTLQYEQAPFWIAMDELMDRCQMTSHAFGGIAQTLVLQPRPMGQVPRSGHASYHGIFRVAATQITAVRDLLDPQNAGMRVRLSIEWEPRITPISLSIPMDKIVVTGEAGGTISPLGARGTRNATVTDNFNRVEIDIPLALPDRSIQRIGSISGVLETLVPGRIEAFRFQAREDVPPQVQRRAGVTVTLDRVLRNEDVFQIHVRLRFDEAEDALESYRGWFYRNEAYLLDAEGNRTENDGMQTLTQSETEIRVAYLFARDRLPEKGEFVYQTPSLVVKSSVPFELRDIDLP